MSFFSASAEDAVSSLLPGEFDEWDLLSKAQWLESTLFLSGYLLSSQGDRMSMAHSVEGRYPFLDHRLIEFASDLPSNLKIKGLNEKYVLKEEDLPGGWDIYHDVPVDLNAVVEFYMDLGEGVQYVEERGQLIVYKTPDSADVKDVLTESGFTSGHLLGIGNDPENLAFVYYSVYKTKNGAKRAVEGYRRLWEEAEEDAAKAMSELEASGEYEEVDSGAAIEDISYGDGGFVRGGFMYFSIENVSYDLLGDEDRIDIM